ncbi:hypothetical protein KFE26_18140 [Shewanella sp. M16]|uniref:hypothetical protein n=1 Tax=Shewanella sp. M16 TaxID=2830837 RepID=UPI001BAED279|nr:hypothetical protein [Shewanella sp. M16]MBS0044207.1 hypothetical protein [Shewanella sp. M16]
MKTSIRLHDNSVVSIQSIHASVMNMRDSYNSKINTILSKYSESWVGNEHEVTPSEMSDADYALYQSMFEARENIKDIAGQLCVLL